MKNKVKTQKEKNKSAQAGKNEGYQWNLGLLYSSANDPQIEKDVASFEVMVDSFSKKYDTTAKEFLTDDSVLFEALTEYEKISANPALRAFLYFYYQRDINASNNEASAKLALLENRLTQSSNKLTFFVVSVGKMSAERQKAVLADEKFSHFKVVLGRAFQDAKYMLSVPEEKILSLKSLPGHSMWVSANDRILNMKMVKWQGKEIPLAAAMQKIPNLSKVSDRKKLANAVAVTLKSVAPFSEAEINAIFTNKKIDDELRGYTFPYEATVLSYRNDPKVIDQLRKTVAEHVGIAHDFYRLKARLLKQKQLGYFDRGAKIGATKSTYSFEVTMSKLAETFGGINPKFKDILQGYMKNGQIDVFPRVGKRSGAYCSGSYGNPTFVMLNHTDDLHSFTTCAHELGHAIHTEFSLTQSPLYCDYSTAMAETASTLFETIGFKSIYDSLSDKEKIIALHDRINDDVSTIFRQIACFNFELDLHTAIRTKGYISKEEIADIHNKNMSEYLGLTFKLTQDDGYFFVTWSHIRNFFYVYTYAFGMLVSKALLRRYKKDPAFWKNIEQFLYAGGKDSPENILKEIGIDIYSPAFFKEGLMEIADDIKELDRLTKKTK
ncbi:MAG TPA: M3 family oligoendopeptidase [Candidatus Paceibacterota bacterium]|jgi:oligoendopeptidase F|nr:M3 family oligoendopeptidase [Candidatus Paceibacterota bacterium]